MVSCSISTDIPYYPKIALTSIFQAQVRIAAYQVVDEVGWFSPNNVDLELSGELGCI